MQTRVRVDVGWTRQRQDEGQAVLWIRARRAHRSDGVNPSLSSCGPLGPSLPKQNPKRLCDKSNVTLNQPFPASGFLCGRLPTPRGARLGLQASGPPRATVTRGSWFHRRLLGRSPPSSCRPDIVTLTLEVPALQRGDENWGHGGGLPEQPRSSPRSGPPHYLPPGSQFTPPERPRCSDGQNAVGASLSSLGIGLSPACPQPAQHGLSGPPSPSCRTLSSCCGIGFGGAGLSFRRCPSPLSGATPGGLGGPSLLLDGGTIFDFWK